MQFALPRPFTDRAALSIVAALLGIFALQLTPASIGAARAQQPEGNDFAARLVQARDVSPSQLPIRERINAWTIGLAAGQLEGAPLRFAAELSRVLDDGDNMRVLTVVTRGIFDNMNDLLYLRGIDAAIIYGDVLEELNDQPEIRKNVNYIASLFPAEMHVLARPEIKSLADLKGKTVNFNTKGTAAAYTGPIVFKRLGVGANNTFIPHPVAIGKMKKGEDVAAVVFVSSKPLAPFQRNDWPEGFHFLPIPYTAELREYYLPSFLTAADYPSLIAADERIATISVPAVLAAFNWPASSDRYRRMDRFVEYFFDRLNILQTESGYHPKWKDINLAAEVPGWNRFPPVTKLLAKRPAITSVTSSSLAAEDKDLFKEFLDWKKNREER